MGQPITHAHAYANAHARAMHITRQYIDTYLPHTISGLRNARAHTKTTPKRIGEWIETVNQTEPQPEPQPTPPPPVWDHLTSRDRFAYAQALTIRLNALRNAVRDTNADLTTTTQQLHTTRARADIAYRHLMKLQKENARLNLKNNRLRDEIDRRLRRLSKLPDTSPQLAEATAESFPNKRRTPCPEPTTNAEPNSKGEPNAT